MKRQWKSSSPADPSSRIMVTDNSKGFFFLWTRGSFTSISLSLSLESSSDITKWCCLLLVVMLSFMSESSPPPYSWDDIRVKCHVLPDSRLRTRYHKITFSKKSSSCPLMSLFLFLFPWISGNVCPVVSLYMSWFLSHVTSHVTCILKA